MNITMKLPGELRDEISLPRAATKESADASAQADSGEPQCEPGRPSEDGWDGVNWGILAASKEG